MAHRASYALSDDDLESLVSFGATPGDEEVRDGPSVENETFVAEVEAAQRLGLLRNQGEYTWGRMEPTVVATKTMTPEKMFSVPRLYTWDSGEPEDLLADLAAKRVRARLQARMGLGKSTRLGPMIARRLNKRVLIVSLDSCALRQTSEYMRAAGLGRIRRYWPKQPGEWVCCMTYADYVGYMMTARRGELNQAFDVTIFDEAFEATWSVFVAKRAFAVYASAEMSLILCSATISEEVSGSGMASEKLGSFKTLPGALSWDEMMASGKLLGAYLVDRTYVVLPTDAEVAEADAYYAEAGVPTVRLDSAGSYEDFKMALTELRGDTVTPRLVVMHHRWAIAFNLEVEFGIIRPFRGCVVEVDGVWQEVQEPMTEAMVTQAMARTGRGISDTSGGLVVGTARADAVELYDSEVDKAFFALLAMHIKPGKSERWAKCYERYPDAIPAVVAHTVLKINLPPVIALRFIGEDGRVAAKYARAISMFSQVDHFFSPSDHEEPKAYADWVLDDWVDPGLGIESRRLVPAKALGELQVVLHGIVAMAEGEIELVRWRPEKLIPIGDYESDDGVVGVVPRRLRRPEHRPLPPVQTEQDVNIAVGFRLDAPMVGLDGKRVARILDRERMREAMVAMEKMLLVGVVESPPLTPVETEAGTVVQLEMGVVNSPGGSVVCELPVAACETLNEGRILPAPDFMDLLRRVKGLELPFVASRTFDGFAGPWESFLRSLLDAETMARVRRQGEWSMAFDIVDKLRRRFNSELVNVLAQSNLTKTLVERIFSRKPPKASKLLREIDEGRFARFGQSEGFFERVKLIKSLLDRVLAEAEYYGLFLPNQVSDAQRALAFGAQAHVGAGTGRWNVVPQSFAGALANQSDVTARLRNRINRQIEF